jgi:hypothetical protein
LEILCFFPKLQLEVFLEKKKAWSLADACCRIFIWFHFVLDNFSYEKHREKFYLLLQNKKQHPPTPKGTYLPKI